MKYLKLYEEVLHDKIPIPVDVKELSHIFTDNGYDLYIVGGAVRDFILGKNPHDYDLVTNAQPSTIERILRDKYRLGLHGRHFAVIRVFTKETPEGIEVASYRKDIAKGRDNKVDPNNPKVEFGGHITVRDDVRRRDLTQNALYYDINKEKIIDIVGGLEDIKNNIIRAVGNPRERFREDRLRILRTFRFAARSKSKIDKNTSQAIRYDNRLNGISEMDDVSQERIIDEFNSMLNWSIEHNDMKSWTMYLDLLKEYKMFVRMFPNVRITTSYYNTFNEILIFTKILEKNKPSNQLHDKLVQDLKLSNRVSNGVIFLLTIKELFNKDNIKKTFDPTNKKFGIFSLFSKKRNYDIDNELIIEYGKLSGINDKYINAFVNYKITTNTADLMKMGFKGKGLGDEIRKIETDKFKSSLNENFDWDFDEEEDEWEEYGYNYNKNRILRSYVHILQNYLNNNINDMTEGDISNYNTYIRYFIIIHNFMVIEREYYPHVKKANKEINKFLKIEKLTNVSDIIEKFTELYNPNHIVRYNIETFDTIYIIRNSINYRKSNGMDMYTKLLNENIDWDFDEEEFNEEEFNEEKYFFIRYSNFYKKVSTSIFTVTHKDDNSIRLINRGGVISKMSLSTFKKMLIVKCDESLSQQIRNDIDDNDLNYIVHYNDEITKDILINLIYNI